MSEHQFDPADGFDASGIAGDGRCYDYVEMCDALRCCSSELLHLERLTAIAEQRWWRLRELVDHGGARRAWSGR